ncbi:hypothetical protein HY745_04695 [Candidatus Desantisbacteria bacterium]|nr:hypothetical protein [Candidatus Desantisbacteria bacterium]
MKIFFDENFSPFLAEGFSSFQKGRKEEDIEVLHIATYFGRGVKDEEWISKVAQMHGTAITQDTNIRRTQVLHELCSKNNIRLFFFKSPKKTPYKYWELIKNILKHWEYIKEYSKNTDNPFSFIIKPKSLKPERLTM